MKRQARGFLGLLCGGETAVKEVLSFEIDLVSGLKRIF